MAEAVPLFVVIAYIVISFFRQTADVEKHTQTRKHKGLSTD